MSGDAQDPFDLDPEAESLSEALSASVGAQPPPSALRARLLDSAGRTHRFPELEAAVASAIDLPLEATRALLLAIDDPDRWSRGLTPDMRLLHFAGGPATAECITGFVRIPSGSVFPEHGHAGDELVLVLQGEAVEKPSGRVYRRGDVARADVDVTHSLVVSSDIPVVYVAVVKHGVVIDGELIGADDPRG